MKDIIGQDVELHDIVAAAAYGVRVNVYVVIGFTPQKIRLLPVGVTNHNYHILKFPSEVVVVPGANEKIQQKLDEINKEEGR